MVYPHFLKTIRDESLDDIDIASAVFEKRGQRPLNAQRLEVRRRLLALLRPKQPAVRSQALAGAACRRRQKKYESPQSTPVAAAQPHASGPSPTERWAMSAEARVMAKPA